MNYRKITATQIFDGHRFLASGTVIIFDSTGTIVDIISKEEAGGDVENVEGILCPGFINAHCHLELSHMKGLIPEHTGLQDFIVDVVGKRHFPEEEIRHAITNAEKEMIADGIIAVGDICNNTHTIFQKQQNNIAYYNFIEVSGWNPSIAQARYEHSKKIFEAYQFKPHNSKFIIQNSSLSPHAPYSVSNDLWDLLTPHFPGKTITIHNQESAAENELFKTGTGKFRDMYAKMGLDDSHFTPTGKTSLQSYYHKLSKASQKILVHNTFISEEDILNLQSGSPRRINLKSDIAKSNLSTVYGQSSMVFFCLCPNANLYIENRLPPIDLLRKNNCTIILGTDSLAGNHKLSIKSEIKTIQKHFPHIPLEEILGWATINGARALQMDTTLGSFEKGKQPGWAVL
ncbi:MAG: amidohydrolase family protein [Chitinophagaceae bacterium]|nr:amidohydrolase family protein [Chitinophagaceae bacterium]